MSESNSSGRIIIIVAIVVVVFAGAIGAWYFGFYKPEQEAKEQARLEQIAQAEAEKKRQEEEAQKRTRYDQLISQADNAFEQEEWESARSLYVEASSLFPNEPYPQNQLNLVNQKLDEIAAREAKVAAGVVESIATRTGRYYVIVSSSIDDDLANDYAGDLAKQGNDVTIIEHDAPDHFYYRVALGDYASLKEAEAALSSYSEYGDGVWVLRF